MHSGKKSNPETDGKDIPATFRTEERITVWERAYAVRADPGNIPFTDCFS
jgi:hypothetical protein